MIGLAARPLLGLLGRLAGGRWAPALVSGGLALLVIGWVGWLRAENAALRQGRDAALFEIAEYKAALAGRDAVISALEAVQRESVRIGAAAQRRRAAIAAADAADDGPIAPVLARTLAELTPEHAEAPDRGSAP